MSGMLVPIDTLGATVKAHIERGDASMDKAEQHYKAAGIHLAEAKERVRATAGLSWASFLNVHCGIRRRRADELIAIADGRTTLEEVRRQKRESVRASRERHRGKPALRSAQSSVAPQVREISAPAPSEDLHAIIARQALEIETLRAENNRLEKELRYGDQHDAGLTSAEELLLNEYYGTAETWFQYLGVDETHPAYPHKAESYDAFLSEKVGFVDIMMMVQCGAFGRLNDYFSSSCTYNGLPEHGVGEPNWRRHAQAIADRSPKPAQAA